MALWAASRAFYAAIGIGLDASTLPYFWQYLDLELLRTRPLESAFFQHTQPPVWNLWLAAALATPAPRVAFRITGWVAGLTLHLGLYGLARRLGLRAGGAVALAGLFAFYPASALTESWVMYTHPVAALLVAAAWLLHRGLADRSRASLAGAFGCMAAVVLTRSLFHLGWLLGVVALVTALARDRRRVLAAAALPVALAASVYVKNAVVFDRFAASTWLGPSLSRLTTTDAPVALRRRLVREGELTELALHLPWLDLAEYPPAWREPPAGTPDVPALRAPRRSSGFPNYNHAAYLRINDAYLADARRLLVADPATWRRRAARAWRIYFIPIHDHSFFFDRRAAAGAPMRAVERAYEVATGAFGFLGWTYGDPLPPFDARPGWPGAAALAAALAWALAAAWRSRRAAAPAATLAFLAVSVLWVALVGNSVEVNENNRFRFLTEPFAWCLVVLAAAAGRRALGRGLSRLRGRRRRGPAPPGRGLPRAGPPAPGRAPPGATPRGR